jgi:hypothetical protein
MAQFSVTVLRLNAAAACLRCVGFVCFRGGVPAHGVGLDVVRLPPAG